MQQPSAAMLGLLQLPLAVLGTLVAVGVPILYILWRRTALKLKLERKLHVVVARRDTACPESKAATAATPLLRFLDLDPAVAASPPLAGMTLVCLREYYASLDFQGSFSLERAVVSIADKRGLTAALPLAYFMPQAWRREGEVGGLLKSFPSVAASRLVTTAISTLDLAAFGSSVHQYASAQRRSRAAAAAAKQQQEGHEADAAERAADATLQQAAGPLDILRQGAGAKDNGAAWGALPSPLLLTAANVRSLLGLTAEEAADASPAQAPAPVPLSPLLPDLHLGNGGLRLTHSRAGTATCGLMAVVANRLTANALGGLVAAASLLPHGGELRFAVQLEEGGPKLMSMEELLDALEAAGHSVSLTLSSNLTSFGVGLSVATPNGSWQQVPLAYPLRTGLWARDAAGQPQDVPTLLSHASVALRVAGPQLSFDLEWCLGVKGFTGWLSYASVDRSWASGPEFKCPHSLGDLAAPGARRRLLRLLTAATCVLNVAGQRDRLLFGGYGHLGVCIDSAAAIQQAFSGRCTLFPLILGGEAKMGLLALYRDAQRSGWGYGEEAGVLAAALAALPCDAVQEPGRAADAARRALACLPQRSVFAAVARCRAGLEAALASALELCPDSG